jgi:hypothetical protein
MFKFFKKKIVQEEVPKIPNVIIDTGEDLLSISPSCMERNEAEKTINGYIHVGNHIVRGCWGILIFYNLDRYKALCCSTCGLRIKIPVEITTAEELKEFLEKS